MCHTTQLAVLTPNHMCAVLATSASQPKLLTRSQHEHSRAAAARSGNPRALMSLTASSENAQVITWPNFFDCMSSLMVDFMTWELEAAFASLFDHFVYYGGDGAA